MNNPLITIPLVEGADATPLGLVRTFPGHAKSIVAHSRNAFGLASRLASAVALPAGDALSKRWLEGTKNPYLDEIAQCDAMLGIKGVYALNLCYEWGCSSGVYRDADTNILIRVLDWPFPRLGHYTVVANQQGSAGAFYNVTWPGMLGVYNAMAPGRFAAAINQAPMRRHLCGVVASWVRNRVRMNNEHGLPPAHLLRQVFETAKDYAEAKRMLAETPIALPVLYILSGTKPGEGCVIERLETQSVIHEMGDGDYVNCTNHFESHFNGLGAGWLPRAVHSDTRKQQACTLRGEAIDKAFRWFTAPIANDISRMAMRADAGSGSLQVMGTEGARPVTDIFSL